MARAPSHADPRPLSEVEFTDPPVRYRYDWTAIAEKLRAHPMEWALIFTEGPTSTVNAVRQGKVKTIHPDLGFEVMTANNTRVSPRTCDFYLRWNPDEVNGVDE